MNSAGMLIVNDPGHMWREAFLPYEGLSKTIKSRTCTLFQNCTIIATQRYNPDCKIFSQIPPTCDVNATQHSTYHFIDADDGVAVTVIDEFLVGIGGRRRQFVHRRRRRLLALCVFRLRRRRVGIWRHWTTRHERDSEAATYQ